MRNVSLILLALNALFWGYLVNSGISDLSRHVPGETSDDHFSQVGYYLGIPTALVVIVFVGAALLWIGRRRAALSVLIGCLTALPVYLFYYTGGM
jgi:hypothetical protein